MKYYASTTEFNCGIDLHNRQMCVCLMDRDGRIVVAGASSPWPSPPEEERGYIF